MNVLAEALGRIGFSWWDEAIAHARWLARVTGRRRRVAWDTRRGRWIVRPAVERTR